jgi:hypothetical protein
VVPDTLLAELRDALSAETRPCRPEYWDGRAAERCVADLLSRSGAAESARPTANAA